MNKVKLIIELDEDKYNYIKKQGTVPILYDNAIAIAVLNGTPLEEELKIIRVKITACTAQGEGNFCDIHNNAIEMARKVVDNRISELKGEKNDTTN